MQGSTPIEESEWTTLGEFTPNHSTCAKVDALPKAGGCPQMRIRFNLIAAITRYWRVVVAATLTRFNSVVRETATKVAAAAENLNLCPAQIVGTNSGG